MIMKSYHEGKYFVCFDEHGNKYWKFNKKLHREDGPAIERKNGAKEWYQNGKRYREGGQPTVENFGGGLKEWHNIKGQYHREDGPAIECIDETKYWYYNGKQIECNSQEEFLKLIKLKAFW